MRVELESTSKLVCLLIEGVEVPARIWEGRTASGVPVHAYVTRIAVGEGEDHSQFDRELLECRVPTAAVEAIPLKLIL